MLNALSTINSIKYCKQNTTIDDFAFKIKADTTSLPTNTTAGANHSTTYAITNVGNVSTATINSRTNCISFSGANYFTIPYAIPNNFTCTFWLLIPQAITTPQTICTVPNYGIQFSGTPYLRQICAIGSFPSPYTSSVIQPVLTWMFYCITQNSTTGSIYINGIYVGGQSGTDYVGGFSPMTFGASNNTNNKYTGYMDDIRFYERELTPFDISVLYAAN